MNEPFHNTLPSGSQDRELEARLLSTFRRRQLPVRQLEVEARDGIVTLRGKVHSFYQRQQYIHCGLNLVGVFRLIDALEVSHATCPIPLP
jgi:osmotically-inducible protein OsmY